MTRKIAILFGGPSPEHEVSLASAASVLAQTHMLGWDVLAVGISKDGRWFVGPGALHRLLVLADPARLPRGVSVSDQTPQPTQTFHAPPAPALFTGYDLVLPLCHGHWGEDGTLQGMLASYGLQVIGSGVAASAVCFDKHLAKTVLAAAGLPVTWGTVVKRQAWTSNPAAALRQMQRRIGNGPWFVKPGRSGNGIGVTAAAVAGDLSAAVEEAFRWDDTALIEEFVPHRELLLGVVGDEQQLTVTQPLECIPSGELLDYEGKHRSGKVRFEPPVAVGPEVIEAARRLAAAAFLALGCQVFAQVDLFLDTRDGSLLVNGVNTVPGVTAQGAFVQLMATADLPYPALLETLYQLTEEIR